MIVEACMADRGRYDAGIDTVHGRPNGRDGWDIILGPVAHCELLKAVSYGEESSL